MTIIQNYLQQIAALPTIPFRACRLVCKRKDEIEKEEDGVLHTLPADENMAKEMRFGGKKSLPR